MNSGTGLFAGSVRARKQRKRQTEKQGNRAGKQEKNRQGNRQRNKEGGKNGYFLAKGRLEHAGYYTISLEKKIPLGGRGKICYNSENNRAVRHGSSRSSIQGPQEMGSPR